MTPRFPVMRTCASAAFLLASVLAYTGCGQKVQTFAPGLYPDTPSPASYSLPAPQLTGAEELGFRIVFPPDYDETKPDKRFPVVYMLHGFGGDQSTFVNNNVPQRALDLMRRGEVDQMILVFPYSGGTVPTTGSSFYTNSVFGAYETWFTDVLVPFVNRNFNADSTRIGISGHSMGAYGAMSMALRHPTMFRSVSAHSGPLHLESLLDPCITSRLALENSSVDGSGTRTYRSFIDLTRLGQTTPLTVVALALSAAFTGHVGCTNDPNSWDVPNSPGMHRYILGPIGPCPTDPGNASLAIGLDFPLTFDGAGGTTLVQDVWNKFLDKDCSTVLARKASAGGPEYAAFKSLRIYLSCGRQDDCDPRDDGAGFLIFPQASAFHDQLDALGIAHEWAPYDGAHSNLVYYQIDGDLKNHTAAFRVTS